MASGNCRRALPGGALGQCPSDPGGPGRALAWELWTTVQRCSDRRGPRSDRTWRDKVGSYRARGGGVRPDRGIPAAAAPAARRRRHPGPRGRRQGVGRSARRRLPARLLQRRSSPLRPTPRCSTCLGRAAGVQHRLLCREAVAVSPGVRGPPRRARHGQRPGHDGCPTHRPVGCVRAGGRASDRRPPGDRGRHGRGRRRVRGLRSSPATPRWSIAGRPTVCTSLPPASALIPPGRDLSASRVGDGDVVICSGTIGDHGTAVMLARGDLALDADIVSDTAPLHELVERLLEAAPSTRWLRDATRGVSGTICNELARQSNLTVVLEEVHTACPAGGGCGLRVAWVSTRCTSPTRASARRRRAGRSRCGAGGAAGSSERKGCRGDR